MNPSSPAGPPAGRAGAFVTFLAHLAAALYHGLIRRDGVLSGMVGRRATAALPARETPRAVS